MSRIHCFADESGNFDFRRGRGASRYFILTAATFEDCDQVCARLQQLRHQIAWEGHDHPGVFHAQSDPQPIRSRVYDSLSHLNFRVDTIILDKPKAQPSLRHSEESFYKYAWFYLMKYVAPIVARDKDELLVVSASIGDKRARRDAFSGAVRQVMRQVSPTVNCRTACWDAACDGCLQVADYCGWAIQRKWEQRDGHAHALIASKIRSEFDLFAPGNTTYY